MRQKKSYLSFWIALRGFLLVAAALVFYNAEVNNLAECAFEDYFWTSTNETLPQQGFVWRHGRYFKQGTPNKKDWLWCESKHESRFCWGESFTVFGARFTAKGTESTPIAAKSCSLWDDLKKKFVFGNVAILKHIVSTHCKYTLIKSCQEGPGSGEGSGVCEAWGLCGPGLEAVWGQGGSRVREGLQLGGPGSGVRGGCPTITTRTRLHKTVLVLSSSA